MIGLRHAGFDLIADDAKVIAVRQTRSPAETADGVMIRRNENEQ